ncbi:hypothetical protein, partial [Pseudonocardia abyssalis]
MTDMYQQQSGIPPQRRPRDPYGHPSQPFTRAAPPVQTRTKTIIIPPRDGTAMTALRGTAYVLTSLASLLFIAVVIYGYVQLGRAQAALEQLGGGFPSIEAPATPGA